MAFSGVWMVARWANVLWARNGGGVTPTPTQLQQFALEVYNAYKTVILPHLSNRVTLEGLQLLYYAPGGSVTGAGHVENSVGGVAGADLTANTAICISWLVPERYKGGHPRTYLPGMVTANMDTTILWSSAITETIRVAANTFHQDVNGYAGGGLTDVHLGTVSFQHKKLWRDPPVFRDFTPTAASVDKRIDSQRRRLGRDL